MLKPVIVRYQGKVSRIYFRADAAFAMPEVYECLEAERIKYAIRLPANQVLQNRIGYLLKRPVGRPPNEVRRFYANFTYQAGSWTKPRRVIAKVEWHPGELYPRVGFIVTNMSAPGRAGRRLLQQARHMRAMDQRRQGRDQVDAAVMPDVRGQRRSASASCARLQSRQFPAHAGDARADQGLVADEPEGEADQDRREGRQPRPLCRLPDGRGRHPTANVPGDFAADRGTAAAATTSASVRRRWSCVQEQPTGGVRPNAKENGQISPSTTVPAAQVTVAVRPASLAGTPEKHENSRRLGVIWGIPV